MAKEKRSFESALESAFFIKIFSKTHHTKPNLLSVSCYGLLPRLFPSLWLRHLALIGRSANLLRAEAV